MHRPVFLQHIERYPSRKEARAREKEIQTWKPEKKAELIQQTTKEQLLSSV
jgi:predicted GIY-YIG superfamily endonuclease